MQNQPASPVSPDGPVLSQTDGPAVNQSAGQTPPHLAGNIPSQPPLPPQNQPLQPPPIKAPKIPNPKRRIIIILIVLALFAAIAGYLFYLDRLPKPAAQVGQENITLEQVANFSRDCDIAQNEAVEFLVDNIVLEKWVQDEKIAFSKEDQKAEEIRISGKEAAINCIAVQAKVNLLREKLSQNTEKVREGKFIYINFGLYANPDPMMAPPGVDNEEERIAKLNEDKSAADNLIQSIYQDLKANKLTFEQAIEKVNSNPKFGVATSSAVIKPGDSFTADDYIGKRNLLGDETVRKKIDELSEGKFSEPFIQKVNISLCQILETDCPAEYVDSAWVIVKVEKIGKGYEESGEKLLLKIREKHNAKIFLK